MTEASGEVGSVIDGGTASEGDGLSGSASSPGAAGVRGTDTSPMAGSYGVFGRSSRGTGVHGVSEHKTGVMGLAKNPGEAGVGGLDFATSKGGSGVYGQSRLGNGVLGVSFNGTGVYAFTQHGTALQVTGRASFSNSGVATVPGGEKTVTVPVNGMTPASIVLATIQAPQAGIAVEGAQAGAGSFVITLSGQAKGDLPVGWFVIG